VLVTFLNKSAAQEKQSETANNQLAVVTAAMIFPHIGKSQKLFTSTHKNIKIIYASMNILFRFTVTPP
jgi:hypothetical protein